MKAYAQDLKDWVLLLAVRVPDWREVPLEDVGEFGAWLPPIAGRGGRGAALGWNIIAARRRNASQAILDAYETFCSEGLTALLVTLPLLRFVVESSEHVYNGTDTIFDANVANPKFPDLERVWPF